MADRIEPADFGRLGTVPISKRRHKVRASDGATPVGPDETLAAFLDGLPGLLGADALRRVARRIARARADGRGVVWAMGAHVVKAGVGPVVQRMIRDGVVTAVVTNGAGAIHDWEMASIGETSEYVDDALPEGRFGMSRETGAALNAAAREAAEAGDGLGEVLGRHLVALESRERDRSILASAAAAGLPVTVHVAVGCDVVHAHPDADGASIGAATFTDFRKLVTVVGSLGGGVWVNCGSAVQLPEVFLKALSAARNLGHEVRDLCTVDLDMMAHYRTTENVLRRPSAGGGEAHRILGHHEINVPLLAAAIELERGRTGGGS